MNDGDLSLQQEIARLVSEGMEYPEVGDRSGIDKRTVARVIRAHYPAHNQVDTYVHKRKEEVNRPVA